MTESSTPGHSRLTKTHKFSIAGVAAVGAAALAFSLVPGNASAESSKTLDTSTAAFATQTKVLSASVDKQQENADNAAKAAAKASAAKAKAAADSKAKAAAKAKSDATAKAKADADAKAKADAAAAAKKRDEAAAASRAAARTPVYADNLDGWINHALAIMKEKGIPGSYDGLYRNIIRESGGNPSAVNGYDINAQNGTPSIGLLQVIQPTFDTYHVAGTANDLYDPVANITAAANYAAATYGSIDNVNGAY
ncbi:transglycosylase SLT domain-containing protein [Streptomyces beijiangensis]|uniref:Transglycosylase SLT domain-containing protein n=1 Tax=Streptomyces beijiangensis TaxID=163361 RepID=A0A939F5U0_9ACTN|nr:transglycosylase SLT domain-containing protein [Streptomyces beijiangensis]MBO0512602.1 transglycosylase SLT domain-containing protein [Streptomyces beijiangensis]